MGVNALFALPRPLGQAARFPRIGWQTPISAPLELEKEQGMLTLFSANPAAWQNAASSTLLTEFARRMATAIQRAS